MTVIDGKGLANEIKLDIKNEVKSLNSNNIFPKLAVIMVGNDSASRIYVNNKSKACEKVGIAFEEFIYDEDISQKMLIDKIKELNEDKSINGILLQCPIPKNLNLNEENIEHIELLYQVKTLKYLAISRNLQKSIDFDRLRKEIPGIKIMTKQFSYYE